MMCRWLPMALLLCLLAGMASVSAAEDAQPRQVLTFYYPWYGTPDGASGVGKFFHWEAVDVQKKDIKASLHYPKLGAYDSHDAKVIRQHCKWARAAGIDGLICSWWGHGSFSDRALGKVLNGCREQGISACIYYESVPPPISAKSAAEDILRVLARYGSHPAYLKVDGKPVVFIYSRAIGQLGAGVWLDAIELVRKAHKDGAVFVGEPPSRATAWVFDGLHAYNHAGHLRGMSLAQVGEWAATSYPQQVRNAEARGRISTLTVIPAYDDTKIRTPGLKVGRHGGKLYETLWEKAFAADPRWVLITSFNEWHEGSEIEPSLEEGRAYLDATRRFAARFKSTPYVAGRPAVRPLEPSILPALREKLEGVTVGVLPGAGSTAYFWLRTQLKLPVRLLSWEDVAAGKMTPQRFKIVLHAGDEHYRRTVKVDGDVDAAIQKYLASNGCLIAAPWRPWPFFYDGTGEAVQNSAKFGLTIRQGWERPPAGSKPVFVKAAAGMANTPDSIPFPAAGDLRWREFFHGGHTRYVPLIRLRDGQKVLGDAVVYTELKTGGRVLWISALLGDVPETELLLADVLYVLSRYLTRGRGSAG